MPHVTRDLTSAQKRMLRFLAAYPEWQALKLIEGARVLVDDDWLTIPSLIELGHVEYWRPGNVRDGLVRATGQGVRHAHESGLL